MKKLIALFAALAAMGAIYAQRPDQTTGVSMAAASAASPVINTVTPSRPVGVYLYLPDTTILDHVEPNGKPVFTVPALNAVVSRYSVTGFRHAYPGTRLAYTLSLYRMQVDNIQFGPDMMTAGPAYVKAYEQAKTAVATDYYPNDFPRGGDTAYHYPIRPLYLEFVHAPGAFGYTHGDSSIVIGIDDENTFVLHPDLASKIIALDGGRTDDTSYIDFSHGSGVVGCAAACTDNGIGYPSIGFNSKISLIDHGTNQQRLADLTNLSIIQNCPIVNASWEFSRYGLDTFTPEDYFSEQDVVRQVYENGTFLTCGSGNSQTSNTHHFPASLHQVFSVSHVGWETDRGPFNKRYQMLIDTRTPGNTYNHCSRVDLCAPAVRLGGLSLRSIGDSFNFYNRIYDWDEMWGTSYAAPTVAGAAALAKAYSRWLSPYQLEYFLKNSAGNMDTVAANQPYQGLYGAGALDANKMMALIKSGKDPNDANYQAQYDPNNPAIQAMTVKGIELNTICAPGYASNGVLPKLQPIVEHGTPPFVYRWSAYAGNEVALDNINIETPTAMPSNIVGVPTGRLLFYRLLVTDASPIMKVAFKTIRIMLKDSSTGDGYDLAMRDSYVDMLDEPNTQETVDHREWQVWDSPDIWNRQQRDRLTTHQNAEYFTDSANHVYVRVRNVGCKSYVRTSLSYNDQLALHSYWSKASTGENWSQDWTTTQILGRNGGFVPAGGQITAGTGILLPDLAPGKDTILEIPWHPVDPHEYRLDNNSTWQDSVAVCLLGRITNRLDEVPGLTEVRHISDNVRASNNIVTRNMIVADLKPGNTRRSTLTVLIGNHLSQAEVFNVRFFADQLNYKELGGTFGTIGKVEIHFGDLFPRVIAALQVPTAPKLPQFDGIDNPAGPVLGTLNLPTAPTVKIDTAYFIHQASLRHYSVNLSARSITVDPMYALEIPNLLLGAAEKVPVTFEYTLNDGLLPQFASQFIFRLQQSVATQPNVTTGAVNFQVNVHPEDRPGARRAASGIADAGTPMELLNVYPNPAGRQLQLRYEGTATFGGVTRFYDVSGRLVLSAPAIEAGRLSSFDISGLVPGTYFVEVSPVSGEPIRRQFVKQ